MYFGFLCERAMGLGNCEKTGWNEMWTIYNV